MSRTSSSLLRRHSRASMAQAGAGGVLAQGPMPSVSCVTDFGYPSRTRRLADRPRSRAARHAGAGGPTFTRVTRHAHLAGEGERNTPLPAQRKSPIVAQLDAANREEGLVFSLGLSYGRGRA